MKGGGFDPPCHDCPFPTTSINYLNLVIYDANPFEKAVMVAVVAVVALVALVVACVINRLCQTCRKLSYDLSSAIHVINTCGMNQYREGGREGGDSG